MKKINNIFVWDADETLGSFGSFDEINIMMERYLDRELTQKELFTLLDIFPEILRPNIIKVLTSLKRQKAKKGTKIVIYTNNNGPDKWIENMKIYIESKVGKGLFDKVIRAYKINGNIIEANRTTDAKTYNDLKKCMGVDDIKNICFIDDQHHDLFDDEHVHGLHIPPYYKTFTKEDVTERLLSSNFIKPTTDVNYFVWFVKNNYNPEKYFRNANEILYSKIDDAILENHIKSFFKKVCGCQTRKRIKCHNKTRKL